MAYTKASVSQYVMKNYGDKDALVSYINQVGDLGEAAALQGDYATVFGKVIHHHEPAVQVAVLGALSKIGEAAMPYVQDVSGFLQNFDMSVRKAAVEALGSFGLESRNYVTGIVALMNDKDSAEGLRAACIKALGGIGADNETAAIRKHFEGKNDAFASAACEALGKMGLLRDDGKILAKMLDNPSTSRSAFLALVDMGEHAPVEALPYVIKTGMASVDANTREMSVIIVVNLGEAASRDPYLKDMKALVKNSLPGVRATAAMAFGGMGSLVAAQIDTLLPLLSDDAEEVSGPQQAQVLGTSSKRAGPTSRLPKAAGLWALGQMQAAKNVKQIGECINDKNWEVRLSAIDALGSIGADAKESADQVAEQLTDAAFPVRASAAYALGQMGSIAHVDNLMEALNDKSHSVRLAAVLAIAELGDDAYSCSHNVFKLVQDPMVPVQAAAIRCLSCMSIGKNYAGVLATMLNHTDAEIRIEVLEALGRMENFGRPFAEDVADALSDPDGGVVDAALRTLVAMGPAGKPLLARAGWSAPGAESLEYNPESVVAMLPGPAKSQKRGYVSMLARERAKLGI